MKPPTQFVQATLSVAEIFDRIACVRVKLDMQGSPDEIADYEQKLRQLIEVRDQHCEPSQSLIRASERLYGIHVRLQIVNCLLRQMQHDVTVQAAAHDLALALVTCHQQRKDVLSWIDQVSRSNQG